MFIYHINIRYTSNIFGIARYKKIVPLPYRKLMVWYRTVSKIRVN